MQHQSTINPVSIRQSIIFLRWHLEWANRFQEWPRPSTSPAGCNTHELHKGPEIMVEISFYCLYYCTHIYQTAIWGRDLKAAGTGCSAQTTSWPSILLICSNASLLCAIMEPLQWVSGNPQQNWSIFYVKQCSPKPDRELVFPLSQWGGKHKCCALYLPLITVHVFHWGVTKYGESLQINILTSCRYNWLLGG